MLTRVLGKPFKILILIWVAPSLGIMGIEWLGNPFMFTRYLDSSFGVMLNHMNPASLITKWRIFVGKPTYLGMVVPLSIPVYLQKGYSDHCYSYRSQWLFNDCSCEPWPSPRSFWGHVWKQMLLLNYIFLIIAIRAPIVITHLWPEQGVNKTWQPWTIILVTFTRVNYTA